MARDLRRPGVAGAAVLSGSFLAAVASWAQERDAAPAGAEEVPPAGLRIVVDYEAELEADTNQRLSPDPPGVFLQLAHDLRFALLSDTRTQSFGLSFGTVARYSLNPGGEVFRFDLSDPTYVLDYSRESVNAALDVGLTYRRREIEFLEPFFLDIDGDTIVDEAGLTRSDGTVTEAGAQVTLETGRVAPIGTTYSASYRTRTYSENADPDLFDSTDYRLRTTTRLRFSEVTEGTVSTSFRQYEYSEGRDLDGQSYSVSAGLARAVSPSLAVDFSLGVSFAEEEETIGGRTFVDETEGLNAAASFTKDLPQGTLFGRFSRALSDGEFRTALSFGRTLEMRDYELTASVGVTKIEDGDPTATFNLGYTQELADGAVSATFERAVTSNTVDEEETLTRLGLNYTRQVTDLSSFALSADLALIEDVGDVTDDDDTTRGAVRASVQRELTRDWAMSVGYEGRYESEAGEDAFSNGVFLTIGRQFIFRP